MKTVIKIWVMAAFCIAAVLQPANADPVLSLTVGPLMGADSWMDTDATSTGNGDYEFADSTSMMGMWDLNYTLTANQDPFISANFTFKNTSTMTQDFILSVSLPITPAVVPSSLIGGSVGLTLTDSNGDGIGTVSTVMMGAPMYSGDIDGTGVLPLYPDPTSFSVPFAGGTTVASTFAGLPGPTIPGPAALTSIGITHKFSLTPGDSVGFTSYFEVIPEPASAGLIALVCGGGLFIRRRFVK